MKKQTYTFLELLQDFKVLIPIIQRDYAHGRDNAKAKDVREGLIDSLWNVVNPKSDKGLHLDFVYGRIDGACLIPFDGQQRLTTLFLFHRYLYEKEKGKGWEGSDVQQRLKKFSYATRPSARDFCEALCDNSILGDSETPPCIDDISDAKWFDVSWLDDPTVKSMIRVLKTIHEKASGDNNIERLNRITFTLADMGQLNMGDMSYISMNSTGRPLTAWENFKASLLESYPNIQEKESLDTKWADYFFKKALSKNHESYDLMMLGMIHLHLSNVERLNGEKKSYQIPSFDQIHSIPYTPFASYKSVLGENASAIIPVFALWNALIDAEAKILAAVKPLWTSRLNPLLDLKNEKLTYADRVTYFAIILFFKYHPKCYNWGLLKSWMRIVNNLVENTTIGHDKLSSHLKLIDDLASHCLKDSTHFTSLWEKLSVYTDKERLCKEQLEEEIEKARLLFNKVVDIESIEAAEKDAWCQGKISILLKTSGIDNSSLEERRCLLEKFRTAVMGNFEKHEKFLTREKFLKSVFDMMSNPTANAAQLWNQCITFPLNDKNQWKEEINKQWWVDHFWDKWFNNNGDLPASGASYNHQALNTLKQSFKHIYKDYTRLWLCGSEFRVATKSSCHYQNCYFMDAYGELEALCMEESISIGWAKRGIYSVTKVVDGVFRIDKKEGDNKSAIYRLVCPECFKKLEGDTFIEKLESLFKQPVDTQTGDAATAPQ